MGADLVFSGFWIKEKSDLKAVEQNMLKEVNKIKNVKQFASLQENYLAEGKVSLSELKRISVKIIKKVFANLESRDVSYVKHRDERFYLSGGLSWGDNPTNSYALFDNFLYLPERVLQAGGINIQPLLNLFIHILIQKIQSIP